MTMMTVTILLETGDLPSPSISDVEDVFLGSGSDRDAPMALEGEHDDNFDDESSPSDADNLQDLAESSVDLIEYDAAYSVAEESTGLQSWRRRRRY